MSIVAYLANQFPSPVEPYVVQEILALRKVGVDVVPASAWPASAISDPQQRLLAQETLYLLKSKWKIIMPGLWLCISQLPLVWEFIIRALLRGSESWKQRLKALCHTVLGAYYAAMLAGRGIEHIHVHHGYFSAWVGMVAARLLGISYSVTLHGSDLLLHDAYLDIKLKHCGTCFTVSDYNRNYVLARFPELDPAKVIVQRLGVVSSLQPCSPSRPSDPSSCLVILSAGRLHPVKNHAFLIDACFSMKNRGSHFVCLIAGEGPERARLQQQITTLGLASEVKLLGQLSHQRLEQLYPEVNLVVLTSRSEGIPLTLMEAMSFERVVLAPAITGIPELVIHGKTGFLYAPGCLSDFIAQIEKIRSTFSELSSVGKTGREHVITNFDQTTNLRKFTSILLSRIPAGNSTHHAHPVLQQV